ncbi:hypothetical protein [Occallatibacter riparius]|uniref:Uncharacterized protein n=1 Tax=Occallatibacter riparius TaxID=1002689 RepID=A0A9J7BLG1_9BACT|nr:hypothetical protein [Occallatibacter riparius]UWZ81726.1 hypothetical protein MOP44_14145 [Occallatibacter riparius]
MVKVVPAARFWVRTAVGLVLAVSLWESAPVAGAQDVFPHGLFAEKKKKAAPAEAGTVRATVQPSFSIAAEPLGYSQPASFYLGMRSALMSLDFLDEDRLLFTFRVPGLISRSHRNEETENERKVRAVVLRLPQGNVESEAVWTLHDKKRYLYNLGNGKFLLRDRDTVQMGDASLQLKPLLQFPGPVLWLEVDPSRQFLVTGSSEPPTQASRPGDVGSPASARGNVTTDAPGLSDKPDMVLRILRREDGKVMLVSHVRSAVHLPINGQGYLELLRGSGMMWTLNFNYFSGGNTLVGQVESACTPLLDFISPGEVLATGCNSNGDAKLMALGLNGKKLWQAPAGSSVWPVLVTNTKGTRIGRESLMAGREMSTIAPLEPEDIKGQDVQILDAATGKLVLRAAATPVFDIGGNVAISPSGRRVAIMMGKNLQIFELPDPTPVPDVNLEH